MKRSRPMTRGIMLCLASSSIITLMMLPAFGQQGASLLASATSDRYRYPDGSRLQAQYENPNEMVGLPATGVSGPLPAAHDARLSTTS